MSFGSSAGPPMIPNNFYNNNYIFVQTADHLICVKQIGDAWHYDDSANYRPFVPRSNDILVATIDHSRNSVAAAEGPMQQHAGPAAGP